MANTNIFGISVIAYCCLTLFVNVKGCLGDLVHRYIAYYEFSPEYLLNCLDLSSEHQALDRVEASIYIWRGKSNVVSRSFPSDLFEEALCNCSGYNLEQDHIGELGMNEILNKITVGSWDLEIGIFCSESVNEQDESGTWDLILGMPIGEQPSEQQSSQQCCSMDLSPEQQSNGRPE
ncbi:hypothetical protein L6452_00630 [Arctium lappa]|uniref:Uncharacterized protein n=1 Tax=Arctium lappa TaxID=4217 RepID=A0ACB9FDX9_ARCLA|nr:hypothetical protein L6452_00630 [Arctium lappa]